MLSQVTLTVEHGDDTDGLDNLIALVVNEYPANEGNTNVIGYTVSVDVDPDSI